MEATSIGASYDVVVVNWSRNGFVLSMFPVVYLVTVVATTTEHRGNNFLVPQARPHLEIECPRAVTDSF